MADPVRLDEFIRGATRLPVMPKATVRLIEALDNGETPAQEIALIVEAEPALAARLLKLANSSFYGMRGRIATIPKAVVILGAKTIRSLALTVWTHTLRAQLRSVEEQQLMSPLLMHGLAAATAARGLVERVDRGLAEDAFTAGLLHDIGRVALVAQLGLDYQVEIVDPAWHAAMTLHEREQALLGFDHRLLGATLLATWQLPAFLAGVARCHHDGAIAAADEPVTAAVALADDYATRLGFNLLPAFPRTAPAGLAAFFGLDDPNVEAAFLEQCVGQVRALSEVLE